MTKPPSPDTDRIVVVHINPHVPEHSVELKTTTRSRSYTKAINQALKIWRLSSEDMPADAIPGQITIRNF